MSYESFNICHGFIFPWRYCKRAIGFKMPGRHIVNTLLNDPQALTHFLHTNLCPVIAVTILAQRDIKFELFNTGIWSFFTVIPVKTGSPETRAGNSPFNSFFSCVNTYSDSSCLEYRIFNNTIIIFFQTFGEVIDKTLHELFPSVRQVMSNTAYPEPSRMHSGTGNG